MNLRSDISFLRRFLLVVFTMLAIPGSLAQDIADFATPVGVVDFLHMDLRLRMTTDDIKARRLHGVVTYKIRVKEAAGVTTVLLDILPLEAVGLDIVSVDLALGADPADSEFAATTFTATGKRLMINLEPHMAPRDEFVVRIVYVAKRPRLGLHFVLPSRERPHKPTMVYSHAEPLQARYWLPCHDWPDTRWPSDVFITVPEPFRAVCVGEPIGEPLRREADGEKLATYHWRQSEPIDSHMFGFAVGELTVSEDEWRGRPVLVYAHPKYKDAARYTFRRTADMIEFYSKLTGVDYPFPRFSHVVIEDHFHGGMEHVGMDFLQPTMLSQSDRNGDVLLDRSQFNYIAHMLAHQWFGGMANYQRMTEAWLNEGFGTYLHQLWRTQAYSYDPPDGQDAPGRVSADWFHHSMWQTARQVAMMDRPGSAPLVNEEITNANQIYGFGGGKIYWKGAWVLHMLRHQLGDETFWGAVKQYLTEQRGKGVETADLRGALERASGRDLKPFFEQWVHRGGTPRLQVDYAWDAERKRATVTVKQTQPMDAERPPFRFPLDLYFAAGSSEQTRTVSVSQAEHAFEFTFEQPPTMMCVDPGGGLLKSVAQSKPPEMWLQQAAGGPTALARSIAIDQLGSLETGDEVVGVLSDCVADESLFWGSRRRAADALAEIGTSAASAALLEIAERERTHPRLLTSVLRAVGADSESKRVHALLLRHAGANAHMLPRATAIRALMNCRADEDLASETVRTIERAALPPNGRYVREAAIRALRKVHDDQTVEMLLRGTSSAADPGPATRARLVALLADLAGEYDQQRARVAEHLIGLLDDPQIAVRVAAIGGLESAGDATVISRLELLTGDDQPRSIRKAAQATIRALHESDDR